MKDNRRVALLALAGLLLPAAALVADEAAVFESAHYRLHAYAPFDEGAEYLALAEALHPQLAEYFGARPRERRLEVHFWPDGDAFRRGAAADGVGQSSLTGGGVYWPGNRRAYFYRQPSAYSTRHLFLHELTHQFHFLAALDNRSGLPTWYIEGIAEHFAYHTWDGQRLVVGRSDVVCLEERIPTACAAARDGSLDVQGILAGRVEPDRAMAWAVVHSLLEARPEIARNFRAVERRMWAGRATGDLSPALLGRKPAATEAVLEGYLGALTTTWKIEWTAWDARGDDLIGTSKVVGLLRSRATGGSGASIEASLATSDGSAGLVVGFRSTDDFVAVYRRPGGSIEIHRREGGRWSRLAGAQGPGEATRLRVVVGEGRLDVLVGGQRLLDHRLPAEVLAGSVGLFVDGGSTRFSDVRSTVD